MDPERARPSGRTRRRLLQTGLGAVLAASTAGCLATLPPLGREVRYGRVDAPEPHPPDYRRLLPAPSAFQDPPDDTGSDGIVPLLYAEPSRLRGGPTGRFPADQLKPRLDYVGIGYDEYDLIVRFGPAIAVEADVDRSAVADVMSDTGYSHAGTHAGYDLYDRSDLPRTLAVGDGVLVFTTEDGRMEDAAAVIDAAEGRADRYHETDPTFEALTAAAGSYPFTWLGETDLETRDLSVPEAFSVVVEDDSVYHVLTRLYPEDDPPTEAELKKELDEDVRAIESEEVDVDVEGRVATIVQHTSEGAYHELNGVDSPKSTFPQITWGVDHDREAGTFTIRHEAGESIETDRIEVVFGDLTGRETDAQFADGETVDTGDDLVVDLADRHEGEPVSVVYRAADGKSHSVGFVYEFDE